MSMDGIQEIIARNTEVFARADAARANPASRTKVFDGDKAAGMCLRAGDAQVNAGIAEDWFWTGAPIFENGKAVNNGAYVHSVWGTPVIEGEVECWRYEDETPEDWHGNDWPASVLEAHGLELREEFYDDHNT